MEKKTISCQFIVCMAYVLCELLWPAHAWPSKTLVCSQELRIWKIGDQMCMQIINRCHALLPHPPTAFFVHPYTELVLIGATQLGALEPLDVDDREQLLKEKAISHEMPLCAALYNENFNQVREGKGGEGRGGEGR